MYIAVDKEQAAEMKEELVQRRRELRRREDELRRREDRFETILLWLPTMFPVPVRMTIAKQLFNFFPSSVVKVDVLTRLIKSTT